MKLNRKAFGRVATTFVATAMLAAFAAVPASADYTTGILETDMTAKSVLRVPANVASPDVNFTYTITTGVGGGTYGTTGNQAELYAGEVGGFTFTDDSVTKVLTYSAGNPQTPVSNQEYYELSQDLVFKVDINQFTHPGIYEYAINVTSDPTSTELAELTVDFSRNVYVYISDENQDGTPDNVAGVVLAKDATTSNKSGQFTHIYAFKDDQPAVASVTLSKQVAGTFGSHNDLFDFDVTLTPSNANIQYYYEIGTVDASGQFSKKSGDNTSGLFYGDKDFQLKHGEAVKVYGLLEDDTFVAVETEASSTAKGYSTENTVDGTKSSDDLTSNTLTINADDTTDHKVIFTNTRQNVTPTGVIMNVAPYVLMVGIAVAGCFVFLRKRRDD